MVSRTTLGAIALMAELAAWPAIAGVPPTERQPVRETVNGVELVDPYRWLEGSAAPEIGAPASPEASALDARVAAWTDAQNAHTRSVLDRLPGREGLETRLRELLGAGSVGAPELRDGRGFFLKRQGEQAQPVLYVRDLAGGPARPLVDPNALDPEGLTSLGWYEPSPTGDLVAFGLFRAGDENTTLYLADVATGAWLADEIPGKVREPSWLPDASGFVYRRLADADDPYSGEVRFHRVGHHRRQDPLLYEQAEEGPLATTWGPYAELSADGDWLILIYWTGTGSNDLYAADFRRFRAGEGLEWKPVLVGEDALAIGVAEGGTLFLRTTLGADNGRVVAIDLAGLTPEAGREAWRELIPERRDATLTDLRLAEGRLVAGYVQGAVSRFEVFTREGEGRGPLALPGPGTAGIATDSGRADALVSFESFNQPATLYRVDLAAGTLAPWEEAEVPVDPDAFEVRQGHLPLRRRHRGADVPGPQEGARARRRQSDGAHRLRRLQHLDHPRVRVRLGALARARRGLRGRQPARRRRVRRGVAPRGHAGEEAERLRRLHRRRRVADRRGLHPAGEARRSSAARTAAC